MTDRDTSSGIALLADAHIGGPGGGAGPLVKELDGLYDAGCRRLIILGDLFQIWVADPRYETPDVREVLAALGRLRSRGARIDYIEGNRDFFVADSGYAGVFETVGTELGFSSGGHGYLVVHGDGLNDRDRQYLFWRWLSKSALSRFLMFHLPRSIAQRLVQGTEQRLAGTNFKHKQRIPEEAIWRFGEGRLRGDLDRLLLGHFHEPRRWPVEGGEVRLLDAWFRTRTVEWIA